MRCTACASPHVVRHPHEFSLFRHMDFGTIAQGGAIFNCTRCGHIFREPNKSDVSYGAFESADYAASGQTGQMLAAAGGCARTRCALQAELLRDLKPSATSVLDIGCFDGKLLSELSTWLPEARLHGFDVNEHLRGVVEAAGAAFTCGRLEQLAGAFDLIVLSHSILYVPDLPGLMAQLERLLAPGGALFVQTPDLRQKPFGLLLGDQEAYFTQDTLINIFGLYGFTLSPCGAGLFPREATVFGGRGPRVEPAKLLQNIVAGVLEDLEAARRALLDIPGASSGAGRLGVLGTTVNASFAHSVLGARVDFFADEHPGKGVFRGLPVLSPSALGSADILAVPFGMAAAVLAKRLESAYGVRCVPV